MPPPVDATAASDDAAFGGGAATNEGPEGLTVSTYTADDLSAGGSRTLAAQTRLAPNGDIETLVSERFADQDALLKLHRGMVEQALASRRDC